MNLSQPFRSGLGESEYRSPLPKLTSLTKLHVPTITAIDDNTKLTDRSFVTFVIYTVALLFGLMLKTIGESTASDETTVVGLMILQQAVVLLSCFLLYRNAFS